MAQAYEEIADALVGGEAGLAAQRPVVRLQMHRDVMHIDANALRAQAFDDGHQVVDFLLRPARSDEGAGDAVSLLAPVEGFADEGVECLVGHERPL